MKKALLSLGLLAGVVGAANAQDARFGVKAGVNLANATGKDVSGTSNHVGLQVGVMANFGFSDLISFQPELLYSQKGFNSKDSGFESKTTLHYVDLPLLLHVNANGLFFEAGPQVGFLAGQKTELSYGGQSTSSTDTEGLRKVDIGYIAGLGYQLESGLSLGVRYNGGLTSLDKNGTAKVYNSAFQFQLGYLFGGK